MHLGVVLGDLDAAVRLALDEEQWKLQLLAGVGRRAIDVQVALRVVQERVGDLDVPLLELGDGDLLLDELKEELLLVAYPFAHLIHILLLLLDHLRR